MADEKITALTELSAAPADDDVLVVVDISDTTQAPSGTTKKVQMSNLVLAVAPLGYSTNATDTYTLSTADKNKVVRFSTTSATVAITCPTDANASFQNGSFVWLYFAGAGVSGTIAAEPGATIERFGSGLTIGGQFALVKLLKVSANTWHAEGDLTI